MFANVSYHIVFVAPWSYYLQDNACISLALTSMTSQHRSCEESSVIIMLKSKAQPHFLMDFFFPDVAS